jgi:pyruvate dehydrogenase E2 component (dihydrolipoamide acetyltransferase)
VAAPISAITMPKWGIEMTEGTITGWRVDVGARVERGAEILDVETEKIVNAVEAPASGVLRRILSGSGDTRAVGALIGVIAEPSVSDAEITGFIDAFVAAVVSFDSDEVPAPAVEAAVKPAAEPAKAAVVPATAAAVVGTGGETGAASDEARVSPIARRVAERLGVDLSKVIGTGRNGRISKEDVETFAAAATPTAAPSVAPLSSADASARAAGNFPVAANPVRRVRMSARRGTIARRLLESKQSIPHYRLDTDVDLGKLLLHKRAQPHSPDGRITVNDLLLRAAALALVQHPMVNAQLEGDEILQFENADIAIAVAAEAGLVTPILRNANLKPVSVIAAESRDLIDRARRGSLLRDEISGGSFTISNLGMFGVTRFDAIINAPQVAILAVGAMSQRAVVRAGVLAVAEVVTLTLSADHRVVDGAVGAAFLSTLRGLLEKPESL